VNAENLLKL